MGKVISMKTRKPLPTEPLTRAKRVVLAVKQHRNWQRAREEMCVTVVRLTAAFEEVAKNEGNLYAPVLQSFCSNALDEIDSLLLKLEVKP